MPVPELKPELKPKPSTGPGLLIRIEDCSGTEIKIRTLTKTRTMSGTRTRSVTGRKTIFNDQCFG